MACGGEGDAENPPVGHRQQLSLLAQVAGQEHHQEQLRELARLHLDAADPDPQLRAVDRGADHHREQQQHDRGHAERVLVGLEPAVVADQEDQAEEACDADHDPDRLVAGEQGVEAVDLGQPHRGEQRRQRQQPGIGVRQPGAQAQVCDEVQGEEEPGVDQRGAADLLLARRVHAQEADAREDGDREQVEELAEPRGLHGCGCPACSAADTALALDRMVWSNSFLRVAGSSDAYAIGVSSTSW